MSDEYKQKEEEREQKKQEERDRRRQQIEDMRKQYEEDREYGKNTIGNGLVKNKNKNMKKK